MSLEAAVHIRLDKRTRKALEQLADKAERGLSDYLRLVLIQHVRTPMRVKKSRAA